MGGDDLRYGYDIHAWKRTSLASFSICSGFKPVYANIPIYTVWFNSTIVSLAAAYSIQPALPVKKKRKGKKRKEWE